MERRDFLKIGALGAASALLTNGPSLGAIDIDAENKKK